MQGKHKLASLQTYEMDQEPVGLPPPPTPGPGRSPLPRTRSVSSTVVSVAAPSAGDRRSGNPPQNSKKDWKDWAWHWISKPSVKVLIILVVVMGISFCPALLSERKYLDLVMFDGATPDPDVDGVRPPNLTEQDSPSD